ncbi:asparagine synthase-related protein [Gaopeijia maritima]
MSGILATRGAPPAPERMRRAWTRVREFGGEDAELVPTGEGVLGVARRAWQRSPDLAGSTGVLREAGLLVAADATLYDLARLRGDLAARGDEPRGSDPAHWIAAAWRVWGEALVDHLVGDFAFVVFDTERRRLVAARDPVGSRPLFHTRIEGGVALASSSRALALLRGSESDLDLADLGAQVAGTLLSMGTHTAYAGVEALRPGFLFAHDEAGTAVRRYWSPPDAPDPAPLGLEEAAEEFGILLRQVVRERMGSGTTSVWMSGGWDSTAVFGAGRAALAETLGDDRDLRPVSIRYPDGDPGWETPWIEATAGRWGAPVEWIDSERIPLVEGLPARAGRSDEPPAHLYELWNVELARGSRRVGARVALDGCGGDNLFQVSDVVMADDLRAMRVGAALRRARARRPLGWRYLVRHALVPLLPAGAAKAIEGLSGRNVPRHHMELARVPWVPERFVREHGLRERDLAVLEELPAASAAQAENMLYVTVPALAWGGSYMRGVLLREGVVARSPLLDPRVIDFALRRPVSDRVAESETKMLLRRAVAEWVPPEVLAARDRRTGVTSGFSARRMRAELPALLDRLEAEPLRLADLGIVEPRRFGEAVAVWRSGGGDHLRSDLFAALRVEFWLRGRDHG